MESRPSRKHHYLPRHYLRGFAHNLNGFYVYDKRSDKIFLTSPDATFFENDLNTVILPKGGSSVFLEDLYSNIESTCWPSLDRIRGSNAQSPVAFEDKEFLLLFLLSLYWRLPSNIEMVENLSEKAFTDDNSLDYITLKNKNGEEIPQEIVEALRGSEAFKKSFRLILPFAPFLKDRKNSAAKLLNWKFLYTQTQESFYIVGDNPILLRNGVTHDPASLLDEFVFPVSGNILLVNLNKPLENGLSGEFIIQYNMAIFEKANRFIVCQNKSFLKALVEHYKVYVKHGKTDVIIDEMFDVLDT